MVTKNEFIAKLKARAKFLKDRRHLEYFLAPKGRHAMRLKLPEVAIDPEEDIPLVIDEHEKESI